VAYVDYRSAFDSVDRVVWLLLRSKGIPEKIIQLLEDLHSCVGVDGELSPWFEMRSFGARQGCIVAPEVFLLPVDWITNRAALGVIVGEEICTDLDYADDVFLLASMLEILALALEILHEESSQFGLEINWSKTKLQVFDDISTPPSKVLYLYSAMTLRLSTPLSTLDPA